MKRVIILGVVLLNTLMSIAYPINYDPSIQPGDIQYFTPAGGNQFVGDCIPFYHNGTFYLYWLLDEGHHSSLGGLGGHQWCVSTTTDLIHWEHHPIAIGIDEDWEKSICTGSVVYANKRFYAFYATRLLLENNKVNEQLSFAESKDGFVYHKHKPNPFYTSAPGYSKRNFRDPKVVFDNDGTFHLFVASEKDKDMFNDSKGCLVHLTSKNLKNWKVEQPILSGVREVPECPDYFEWNGWYYLIYGQGGDTYYVKSKSPYGPWEYPESQALLEQWVNVAKTAEFTQGRRIVAGWIPSRSENKDNGGERFGGSIVLREAYQLSNGDLATKFPEEVVPQTSEPLNLTFRNSGNSEVLSNHSVDVNALGTTGAAFVQNVPSDCKITFDVIPQSNCNEYGLILRSDSKGQNGYKLAFNPNKQIVRLGHGAEIESVKGLNEKLSVTIIMKGDIIDVCIDNKRCIVNRQPEYKGDVLWLYARQGAVSFNNIKVAPLKK